MSHTLQTVILRQRRSYHKGNVLVYQCIVLLLGNLLMVFARSLCHGNKKGVLKEQVRGFNQTMSS